jgi:hypothetical protein
MPNSPKKQHDSMNIRRAFQIIGFAIGVFMASTLLLFVVMLMVGCNSPKRFLKRHPEYAKVVHDTIIKTSRDTIIVRKEVIVRDTIHYFSKLEIGKEYVVRDTLNRVEIRYTRSNSDELQIQGKQLAVIDTLKNAIKTLNYKQQLVRTITETKIPTWAGISFVFLLIIILILLILRILRK